jgi:hypothetical protein
MEVQAAFFCFFSLAAPGKKRSPRKIKKGILNIP